jgi:hypothetical protein
LKISSGTPNISPSPLSSIFLLPIYLHLFFFFGILLPILTFATKSPGETTCTSKAATTSIRRRLTSC